LILHHIALHATIEYTHFQFSNADRVFNKEQIRIYLLGRPTIVACRIFYCWVLNLYIYRSSNLPGREAASIESIYRNEKSTKFGLYFRLQSHLSRFRLDAEQW